MGEPAPPPSVRSHPGSRQLCSMPMSTGWSLGPSISRSERSVSVGFGRFQLGHWVERIVNGMIWVRAVNITPLGIPRIQTTISVSVCVVFKQRTIVLLHHQLNRANSMVVLKARVQLKNQHHPHRILRGGWFIDFPDHIHPATIRHGWCWRWRHGIWRGDRIWPEDINIIASRSKPHGKPSDE